MHHAVVSTGVLSCTSSRDGLVPCDTTVAANVLFVQPGFSIDRMIGDTTYLGGRVGLDLPGAGPVAQFMIGYRPRGR